MQRDISRPWGDLMVTGRGRGAKQGTITEPQEHTQGIVKPREGQVSGTTAERLRWWRMIRIGLKSTGGPSTQTTVGKVSLHLQCRVHIFSLLKAFHCCPQHFMHSETHIRYNSKLKPDIVCVRTDYFKCS